jgi:rhamnogalacturonyl hydrolase YesR
MVPPFLAYYGVATHDMRYMEVAVSQCHLYGEVLSTNITLANGQSCHGLWRHIISDPATLDPGVCCSDRDVWLTSSAWAIAGITRVLATVLKWRPHPNSVVKESEYNNFKTASKATLTRLIASMLHCTMSQARDEETGLLKNYLDGPLHRSSRWAYGDAAGTALMASAVYRLAVLLPEIYALPSSLAWADQNRRAVATHIDQHGRVFPVADVGHVPSKWPVNETSEAQSMAVLMYSAWRDCVDAGICSRDDGMWNNLLRWFRSWW